MAVARALGSWLVGSALTENGVPPRPPPRSGGPDRILLAGQRGVGGLSQESARTYVGLRTNVRMMQAKSSSRGSGERRNQGARGE